MAWNTPWLAGEALLELIPQRSPIVMVDRFFGLDDEGSYTGLTVKGANLFCWDGVLDECGLVEHIAQSAAVRVGYIYKNAGEKIPVGFIGSVNKMNFHALPKVGDELRTTIRIEQEIFDITLISASVRVGDQVIADGELKIFLKKEA